MIPAGRSVPTASVQPRARSVALIAAATSMSSSARAAVPESNLVTSIRSLTSRVRLCVSWLTSRAACAGEFGQLARPPRRARRRRRSSRPAACAARATRRRRTGARRPPSCAAGRRARSSAAAVLLNVRASSASSSEPRTVQPGRQLALAQPARGRAQFADRAAARCARPRAPAASPAAGRAPRSARRMVGRSAVDARCVGPQLISRRRPRRRTDSHGPVRLGDHDSDADDQHRRAAVVDALPGTGARCAMTSRSSAVIAEHARGRRPRHVLVHRRRRRCPWWSAGRRCRSCSAWSAAACAAGRSVAICLVSARRPRRPAPAVGFPAARSTYMPPATSAAVSTQRPAKPSSSRNRSPRNGRDEPRATTSQRAEPVAEAAHGLHVARVGRIVLDLGAQPLHARVDQPGVAEICLFPHGFQQLLAAEHPAGRARTVPAAGAVRSGRGRPARRRLADHQRRPGRWPACRVVRGLPSASGMCAVGAGAAQHRADAGLQHPRPARV